ncbi:hypothetical protein DH2020_001955 [Rehmannia glutinosa]|uniref:Uncharacterized protein n=1 Tax=Rehmannia glutinosa TaxID=99300 RepID=A0ABR0XSK6_REHGL
MQSLQEKASEWSGVHTNDAFAIDETNLYEKLGLQTFINLSTNFYNRVYDDEEEWFRSIFANSKKEDAIQNQYEFFVQRMGGPPLYSQRRGLISYAKSSMIPLPAVFFNRYHVVQVKSVLSHPALIARHRPFPVTRQAAERWLHHMQQALDSTSDIDSDSKIKMMNFLGDELKNQRQAIARKHATEKPSAV